MKSMKKTQIFVLTAMLAAVAGVLMSFEFPLPMMPPFYKIDFSDVPAIIAVFLTWLGDKLGLPLYLAAVVVFGTRMFQNFAEIRRELLTSRQKKARIEQDINHGQGSENELP